MANTTKSGGKQPPKSPPHREHNAPGGPKNPFGARADKATLLERMRANAGKAKEPPAEG